ncbi:MAG: hypothetical protein AB4038_11280 [Prochloraceae cyanobacterium]
MNKERDKLIKQMEEWARQVDRFFTFTTDPRSRYLPLYATVFSDCRRRALGNNAR